MGEQYAPSDLRTIRRALVSRISRMLQREFELASKNRGPKWNQLTRFFEAIDPQKSAFLIMNWDTVVEARLEALCGDRVDFTYTGDSVAANFPLSGNRIVTRNVSGLPRFT